MSVHRRRGAGIRLLVVGLPLLVGLLLFLTPGSVDDKLIFVLRGVSAQRPSHSFMVDGRPLALEARMYGIFVGFSVAVAAAWAAGRWRRSEVPRGWSSPALASGIAIMGLDGLNALLFDLRGPHLYPPDNALRLGTGLLSGLGLAAFIAPVVSFAFFRERDRRPLFASTWEVILSAVPLAGIAAVVVAGVAGALLSAVAAVSVIGAFWLVNTYICVLAWEGVGHAESWADLAPSALVGFVLTAGLLAGLALLRSWVETTLGISWVV